MPSVQGVVSQSWLLVQAEPQATPQTTPLPTASQRFTGQLMAAHCSANVAPELEDEVLVLVLVRELAVDVEVELELEEELLLAVAAPALELREDDEAEDELELGKVKPLLEDEDEPEDPCPEELLELTVPDPEVLLADEALAPRDEPVLVARPEVDVVLELPTWISPELEVPEEVDIPPGMQSPRALQSSPAPWQSELTAHSTSQLPASAPVEMTQVP